MTVFRIDIGHRFNAASPRHQGAGFEFLLTEDSEVLCTEDGDRLELE